MRAQRGVIAFTASLALALGGSTFQPARFLSGSVPQPPPQTTGRLDALFQVRVTATGTVEAIDILRGSEPLVTLLHDHLQRWRFAPARDENELINASVLVAATYRPASLFDRPSIGERSPRIFDRSAAAPIPMSTPPPAYPPRAAGDGVVVLEVLVTAEGNVSEASVVRSAGAAFDSSALQAGRRWRFHPATPSSPRPTFAYVIFGFRQPVVTQ